MQLTRSPRLRPSPRLVVAVVAGVAACLACGALRAPNLPLDDAYIHLSYGLDFSPRTLFSFQAGERDTGTSSWVWTAICIAVTRLGLPVYGALTVLSMAIFCAVLRRVIDLVDAALPPGVPLRRLWPYASAALLAASGNVLWLSLSGMETGLSVLLLLILVPRLLSPRGMTLATGLCAVAAAWTRIESLVWILAATAVAPFVGGGEWRRARRGWPVLLAGLAVYFGYDLAVGGHLLPTSGVSKRATFVPGGHSFAEEWAFVAGVARNYARPWLPGWRVEVVTAALSFATLLGLGMARWIRRGVKRPRLHPGVAAVGVLVGGAFAHAALNVVEFRSAYHHMRYFTPLLFLVPAFAPTLLLVAVHAAAERLAARSVGAVLAVPLAAWAMALDLRAFPAWRALYRQNAEQLGAVHLALGRWLREEAPRAQPVLGDPPPHPRRVASFDIGALRWASRLEIVDMAGTSTARALAYQTARREVELLRDTRADFYVSVENGFDFIPTSTPFFGLELVESWQYPEYRDPFPPHSKRMVLYRVNHCGAPRLVRRTVGPALSFETTPSMMASRPGLGRAEGTAFSRWPVNASELGRPVPQAHGRFLASDADPLRDRAVGRFETIPMIAEGDFLSFRLAGGHDPERLRVELRSEGHVLATWTGFDSDAFLEHTHPIGDLRGKPFTVALVDEATGSWGHLLLDDVQQIVWRELPAKPCPVAR